MAARRRRGPEAEPPNGVPAPLPARPNSLPTASPSPRGHRHKPSLSRPDGLPAAPPSPRGLKREPSRPFWLQEPESPSRRANGLSPRRAAEGAARKHDEPSGAGKPAAAAEGSPKTPSSSPETNSAADGPMPPVRISRLGTALRGICLGFMKSLGQVTAEAEWPQSAVPLEGHVLQCMLVYLVGYFGLLSWRVFIVLILLYGYSRYVNHFEALRTAKVHMSEAASVLTMCKEPEREVRDYNPDWFNKLMYEYWPNCLGPWLTEKLRLCLTRLINEAMDSGSWSAAFECFSLGERAPDIIRIREHMEANKFILDLDFMADCTGMIRLRLRRKKDGKKDKDVFQMELSEVRMRGVVRLMFIAFLPTPPYFAQLSVSFAEQPHLDFNFSMAGLSSVIGHMVKRVICRNVLSMMVYPHEIPVSIYDEDQLGEDLAERFALRLAPKGMLVVRLRKCMGLKAADVNGRSDPYVKLQLGTQMQQSSTIKRNCNPDWTSDGHREEFRFKIWQWTLSVIHVEVWDEDTISGDDFLGSCEIELRTICLEEDSNNKIRIWRLFEEDPLKHAGTIELEFDWFALNDNARPVDSLAGEKPRLMRAGAGRLKSGIRGLLEIELVSFSQQLSSGAMLKQKDRMPEDQKDHKKKVIMDPYIMIHVVEHVLGEEIPEGYSQETTSQALLPEISQPLLRQKIQDCPEDKTFKSNSGAKQQPALWTWNDRLYFEIDDAWTSVVHVEVVDAGRHLLPDDRLCGELNVPLRAFLGLGRSDVEIQAVKALVKKFELSEEKTISKEALRVSVLPKDVLTQIFGESEKLDVDVFMARVSKNSMIGERIVHWYQEKENDGNAPPAIRRFLPQCVEWRWHRETIVPTQWKLSRSDQSTTEAQPESRLSAKFKFSRMTSVGRQLLSPVMPSPSVSSDDENSERGDAAGD
eukprot:gnl/TRDRNA2_/TRDRNA2_153842_c0_seq1.p1 gnl/TRDRNA2_/TRDRNA2_153842_c0~~gnl/TRDRNA2_/TRDRNA2_153842_c0_seq1.p1  ORF type:complete len:922 (-),score=179.65 gnl/TRDRNA2_/TRDRNA2_153842_c0_seq1:160-2925(-)